MKTSRIEILGLYTEVRFGSFATERICCIVAIKSPRAMPYLLGSIDICIVCPIPLRMKKKHVHIVRLVFDARSYFSANVTTKSSM